MDFKKFNVKTANITEYIPLKEKRKMVTIGVIQILDDANGITVLDPFMKEIFLAYILSSKYFGLEVEDDFTEEYYDEFHKTSFISRVEYAKYLKGEDGKKTDIAKKVSSALEDFAMFTKLLNTELNNELSIRNNLIDRLMDRMNVDLSPEQLQEAVKQLEQLPKEIGAVQESLGEKVEPKDAPVKKPRAKKAPVADG